MENSLEVLTDWLTKNRKQLKLNDEKSLLDQWISLKTNILNTKFNKIMISEKKPSLLEQDCVVIKEAFTNPDVYNNVQEIVYLLENCLKICSECVCESGGSVIGNHIYSRAIKADNLFHEAFISWNGSPVHKVTERH